VRWRSEELFLSPELSRAILLLMAIMVVASRVINSLSC
jgi:hypothetical protein